MFQIIKSMPRLVRIIFTGSCIITLLLLVITFKLGIDFCRFIAPKQELISNVLGIIALVFAIFAILLVYLDRAGRN